MRQLQAILAPALMVAASCTNAMALTSDLTIPVSAFLRRIYAASIVA
jgi:hypothetical protein